MNKVYNARRKACYAFYRAATLFVAGTPSQYGYDYDVANNTAYSLYDVYVVYDERTDSYVRPDEADEECLNVIEALAYILCYAYDDSKYFDVIDAIECINSYEYAWVERLVQVKHPRETVHLQLSAISQARLLCDLWVQSKKVIH